MRSMVRPRRALALLSIGLLCSLAVPAAPAGASPSVEPVSAPTPVQQSGSSCDPTGNCNRTTIQLPFFYDDGKPWWDMEWERQWANDLQSGESNWVYFPEDVLLGFLEDYDAFCLTVTAGIGILDVPIIGDLAQWVASSLCDLVRPFVWVAQQIARPIVAVLSPLYTLIARTLDWTSRQIIGGGLGVFFTFAQTPLKWANDAVSAITGAIGTIGGNIAGVFVYDDDLQQLKDHLFGISLTSTDTLSNLGDVAGALGFRSLGPTEGCVSIMGQNLCPIQALNSAVPDAPLWGILFALWVGFWALFSTIVGVGAFARMTDS